MTNTATESGRERERAGREHEQMLAALLGSAHEGGRALHNVPHLKTRSPAAMRETFDWLVHTEGEEPHAS
jgi:hypothetical protein